MDNKRLNILPVPTFGWLGVNDAVREIAVLPDAKSITVECRQTEPVRIDLSDSKEYDIILSANEGDSLTVIEYNTGDSSSVSTRVKAKSGSRVKLIQVIEAAGQTVNNVSAEVLDNASFEYVLLTLSGADTLCEIKADLAGRGAGFDANIGYKVSNEDKLDINLLASHKGKKTVSNIAVSGVLSNKADKTFKGTIDFLNGAVGAVGAEKEEVLLLDESVINKTVPLILCAEEDVEGSHGASIGRIDEKQVFYMQSRGLDEQRIYELMANAKITRLLKYIDDEQTLLKINNALDGGNNDE